MNTEYIKKTKRALLESIIKSYYSMDKIIRQIARDQREADLEEINYLVCPEWLEEEQWLAVKKMFIRAVSTAEIEKN